MNLYGKALANQVSESTTGYQARAMFGAIALAMQGAYQTLADYDLGNLGEATGLDFGSIKAARDYLDSTNTMATGYYSHVPESSAKISAQQLAELKAAVSTSSAAVKTIDDLFSTSFLADLCDAIVAAVGTVSAAIANGVAKVAGSFVGGTWWLFAAAAAIFFVYRGARKRLTS